MEKVEKIDPYHDGRSKEEQVESMFDSIAPAYDFMNSAMTMGLHRLWLKRLVAGVCGNRVIDLATGTGDVAIAIAKARPGTKITGLDLSEGMLAKAREKAGKNGMDISFAQCDCIATGLPQGCADDVTVAYGVRNYADILAGLKEMHRLLCPGGKVHILELSVPTNPFVRPLYNFYTKFIIPVAGRIMSRDVRAYSYLPESIAAAPQGKKMASLLQSAGFTDPIVRPFTFGVCTLYTATKKC